MPVSTECAAALLSFRYPSNIFSLHVQFVKKGNLKYGGPEGSHMQIKNVAAN